MTDPREAARYPYGRPQPDAVDEAWDTARFANPFPFPMTAGPIVVVDHGRFVGQSLTLWTNPGEPDTVRLTKALSVAVHGTLAEAARSDRDQVFVGSTRYARLTLDGELSYANRRSTPVTLEIVRDVAGEIVSADGDPARQPQENAADVVQRHTTLKWTLTVKPSDSGKLRYRYTTLEPS